MPLKYSIAPARPFMRALATAAAAPSSLTASFMARKPSLPAFISGIIAFMPSLRRMVSSAARRCSCDNPPNCVLKMSIMSTSGIMFPLASKMSMLYAAIASLAFCVGPYNCVNIFLSAVPASVPLSPTLVKMARLAARSSTFCPAAAKAKLPCAKPSAKSPMSAALALAAAANRLATRVDSLASRLNALRTLAVSLAAVARSTSPAAARSSTPGMATSTSLTAMPALLNSNCASAASLALNTVSLPSLSACLLMAAICSVVAFVTCSITFIETSKSAALSSALLPSAIRGIVTATDQARPMACIR